MDKENHIEIHERITRVETDQANIKDFIGDLRSNHLPHIYNRLSSLDKKIAYGAGAIGALELVILILQAWGSLK